MPRARCFAYGSVTLYGASFHRLPLHLTRRRGAGPTTPGAATGTAPVWALARSLATTCAIIVIFSSSGYLDVSVPRVRPPRHYAVWRHRCRRVSPFGHPRVAGHLPLAAAFRSLSRPSSPPRATGIPHAPFLSFLSPSSQNTAHNGLTPQRHMGACECLIDLLISCRSIALSTRFLRFDSQDSPASKGRPLYSSRSQHVNDLNIVEDNGLEPLTPCLQSRCSTS